MRKLLSKAYMLGFASLLGLTLTGCGSNNQLELKKEVFTIEYGETVSTNAKDYLVKDTEKDVLKEAKVIIKLNKKTPTDVGTYDASIKYKEESVKFKVQVKDTVKPEFLDFKEEIKVEQNAENVDFTKYFKAIDKVAEDEVAAKISVDSKNVDLSTLGTYEIKVTATDENKNKTTKKAKVVVVSSEEAEAGNVDSTTDGSTPVSQATQQKQESNAIVNNNTTNNSGTVDNGSGNSGGSVAPTPNPTPTPPTSAPYIVDDGRSYQYNPNTLVGISMQSPIFNTDEEAFTWAYASSYWTSNRYGFETVSIIYSDGTEKVSVSWYK